MTKENFEVEVTALSNVLKGAISEFGHKVVLDEVTEIMNKNGLTWTVRGDECFLKDTKTGKISETGLALGNYITDKDKMASIPIKMEIDPENIKKEPEQPPLSQVVFKPSQRVAKLQENVVNCQVFDNVLQRLKELKQEYADYVGKVLGA